MKTVTVTEFKSHCLELINEVGRTGQPLLLTKRGKPSAMVSLPPVEAPKVFVLGQLKGTIKIVGDLIEPFDEPWEALS